MAIRHVARDVSASFGQAARDIVDAGQRRDRVGATLRARERRCGRARAVGQSTSCQGGT
jgi:hypothetical protein